MSFALPDLDSGYGYQVTHKLLTTPAQSQQINNRTFNKTPVLLGPNIIDPDNPPVKKKNERVYKPCERLLIRLKKEQLKNYTLGSNP